MVNRIKLLQNNFGRILKEAGVQQDFTETLLKLVVPGQLTTDITTDSPGKWAILLPGLCCQAAGGDPHWADTVAAAWFLFYVAAHILDTVEDGEDPDEWWVELGIGPALNLSTGLIFGASSILNNLYEDPRTQAVAGQVNQEFYRHLLKISGGQHRDLTIKEMNTKEWWEIAEEKTGTAFALACQVGSQLATDDAQTHHYFGNYGNHLGLLIQLFDDVIDLFQNQIPNSAGKASFSHCSLPIVYAMEVLPTVKAARLLHCMNLSQDDTQSQQEVLELLNESGAPLYLKAELDFHKRKAQGALEKAAPPSSARQELSSLVTKITLS